MEIRSVNYLDVLREKKAPIVSLDISVNSTGWVVYIPGDDSVASKIRFGTYTVPIELRQDINSIRQAFRSFVLELLQSVPLDKGSPMVFIEDFFGGRNFNTFKVLARLNYVVDDLIMDGFLPGYDIKCVKRIQNQTWKAFITKLSGYASSIRGAKVKDVVRGALTELGLSDTFAACAKGPCLVQGIEVSTGLIPMKSELLYPQDVWDAFGIMLCGAYGKPKKEVPSVKLPSLSKVKLSSYSNEEDFMKAFSSTETKVKVDLGFVDDLEDSWDSYRFEGKKSDKFTVGFSIRPYNLGKLMFNDNFCGLSFDYTADKVWFIASK